jgi:hypothetical protein
LPWWAFANLREEISTFRDLHDTDGLFEFVEGQMWILLVFDEGFEIEYLNRVGLVLAFSNPRELRNEEADAMQHAGRGMVA